ncbi:regenerating islet-derived protein 4 [Sarotherodon galilaeus]
MLRYLLSEGSMGIAIRYAAVTIPDSDAAAQDTLGSPPVEGGENGWWEMGFPQLPQEAEALLGLLGYGAGVEAPGEVLCQVNTEEFGALDDLHRGSINVKWTVISLCSPEVQSHVVDSTPVR